MISLKTYDFCSFCSNTTQSETGYGKEGMTVKTKKRGLFLKRLVLSYCAIFAVVMLLFMAVFYQYIQSTSIHMADLNQRELASQSLKQTELFLDEMEDVAYRVMTSSALISLLGGITEHEVNANYFKKDVLLDIEARSLLRNINGIRSPIWRIMVFNPYGDFVSSGTQIDEGYTEQVLKGRNIAAEMALHNDGKSRLSAPEKDRYSDNYTSTYVTMTVPIMNIYSREVYGVAEIMQDMDKLVQMLRFEEIRGIDISITDSQERIILPSKIEKAKKAGQLNIVSRQSEKYGWKVTLTQTRSNMLAPYRKLLTLFFAGCAGLTAIMFFVIIIIARRLSQPLVRLKNTVRGITLGSMPETYEGGDKLDEIRQLDLAFESMLKKLNYTVEQEKKAALFALQSQINPHFLYNTLTVISAAAMESGQDRITRMCENMSAMMRYSASYKNAVSLKEELDYLNRYLELMRERYEGLFHFTVEYDEELLTMLMPKLILEPLAENCFKHAFNVVEPPYVISVEARKKAEEWSITVADNGGGFSPQMKTQIMEALEDYKTNPEEAFKRLEIGGLGLRSSILRLMLHTGKDIFCRIEENKPGGTRITIGGSL